MKNETKQYEVLVVDDAPENLKLLSVILRRARLVPRPVRSGKLAIEAAVAAPPDLMLLDISMPEMSGFDVCRWFKQDTRLKGIPIVFISGLQDIDDKIEAFRIGGVDYISKPFQEAEVVERIRTHLRLKQLEGDLESYIRQLELRLSDQVKQITASHMATIFALAKLAEARDNDTGQHVERVQAFSKVLAERMREERVQTISLTTNFIDNLFEASCLHDIGKVGVPDSVLLKPGKLNDEELHVMKSHSALGAETLATVLRRFPENQLLCMGVDVARSHHERWDGTGYPDNIAGETIPLSARIVAIADVYDALTSRRCYHAASTHETACHVIQEGCGRQFDPQIVKVFCEISPQFNQVRSRMTD